MVNLLLEAQSWFKYTRELRRDFHRHPELGFLEVRTAGIVASELSALGLEVNTGIAQTGVVGVLEGESGGPMVLLRFDMDALPIHEQSQTDYVSQNPGVMHACGHDGHTAIGLTVTRLLQAHRPQIKGKVKLIFQPAEEGLGGAEGMIAAGVLENPKPTIALAVHIWNEKPLGWLGISAGPVMASAEIFSVRICGRGGHGAIPHLALDPIVASAQIITALQSITARNIAPLDSAVVSVTTIHGGDAYNVIPGEVILQGTIRTFIPATRTRVLDRFQQIVQGIAQTMECQAEIELRSLTPAVINDTKVTAYAQQTAAQLFPEAEFDMGFRTMGSEDMAFLLERVPGCFIFLGSANPKAGLDAAHHHPRFDFDEQVLPRAAALIASVTLNFLQEA